MMKSEAQQALKQLDDLSKKVVEMEAELDEISGIPKGLTTIESKIKYLKDKKDKPPPEPLSSFNKSLKTALDYNPNKK